MCERDPAKRADVYEVLWDEWVNEGYRDLPYVGSAGDEKYLRQAGEKADKETEDTVDLMMRFCGHDPTVLDADLTNKYIEKKLRELLVMAFQRNAGLCVRLPLFEENVPVLVAFRRKVVGGRGMVRETLWREKKAEEKKEVERKEGMAPLLDVKPVEDTSFDLDTSFNAIALKAAQPSPPRPKAEEKPVSFTVDFGTGTLDLGLGVSVPLPSASSKPPISPISTPPSSHPSTNPSSPRTTTPVSAPSPVVATASSKPAEGSMVSATPSESPSLSRKTLGSVLSGWSKRKTK
jgi:hypothetical protein